MSEVQARDLLQGLAASGIRCWLVGGWGIDALLGHQTRGHHDLDLLVDVQDLPELDTWLRREGFRRSYEWDENAPVEVDGQLLDTAFVEHHGDGRELDIHAVHVENGSVHLATTDSWELPNETLGGTGRIGGYEVRCASVKGQRAMHAGYNLPATHLADLRQLDNL